MCKHWNLVRPTDTEIWQCNQLYRACRSLEVDSEAEVFQHRRKATNVETVVTVIGMPCSSEAWFVEATEATSRKVETIMDELIGGLAPLLQIRQERGPSPHFSNDACSFVRVVAHTLDIIANHGFDDRGHPL